MTVDLNHQLQRGLSSLAELGDGYGAERRVHTRVRRRRRRRVAIGSALCLSLFTGVGAAAMSAPTHEPANSLDASDAPSRADRIVTDQTGSTTSVAEIPTMSTTVPANGSIAGRSALRSDRTPNHGGADEPAPTVTSAPPYRTPGADTEPTPNPSEEQPGSTTPTTSPPTVPPVAPEPDPVPSPNHLVVVLDDSGFHWEPKAVEVGWMYLSFADRRTNPEPATLKTAPASFHPFVASAGTFNTAVVTNRTIGRFQLVLNDTPIPSQMLDVVLGAGGIPSSEPPNELTIDVSEGAMSFPRRNAAIFTFLWGQGTETLPVATVPSGPILVTLVNGDHRRHEIEFFGNTSIQLEDDEASASAWITFPTPSHPRDYSRLWCSRHGNQATSEARAAVFVR